MYSTLEDRIFHEGRYVTPSFIEVNNMLPPFQELGLESFLKLNEHIFPRFVTEFYHSLEVKRSGDNYPYIELKLGNRDHVNACTACMLYYLKIKKKFNLTAMILLRMKDFMKSSYSPMLYVMLLTRLFKHILLTSPQSIVPFDRFRYHKRVMISLDTSRKTIKDKGKRAALPHLLPPPHLMKMKIHLPYDSMKIYQTTRTRNCTPSLSPRGKSLSPPHAPSKSTSSVITYKTTSSSPSESPTPTYVAPPLKLRFVIPMNLEPQELPLHQTPPHDTHVSTVDNWPPGPSNPSPPLRVSHPPPGFEHPPLPRFSHTPPRFEHP
nr:hypothetical protein [Tanacetum cinerariifolium]